MSWNLRVLVTESPTIGGENGYNYAIHEVYYNSKGVPNASTKRSINVSAEDMDGLEWYVNKMKEALNKPILWGDHRFPQEFKE